MCAMQISQTCKCFAHCWYPQDVAFMLQDIIKIIIEVGLFSQIYFGHMHRVTYTIAVIPAYWIGRRTIQIMWVVVILRKSSQTLDKSIRTLVFFVKKPSPFSEMDPQSGLLSQVIFLRNHQLFSKLTHSSTSPVQKKITNKTLNLPWFNPPS